MKKSGRTLSPLSSLTLLLCSLLWSHFFCFGSNLNNKICLSLENIFWREFDSVGLVIKQSWEIASRVNLSARTKSKQGDGLLSDWQFQDLQIWRIHFSSWMFVETQDTISRSAKLKNTFFILNVCRKLEMSRRRRGKNWSGWQGNRMGHIYIYLNICPFLLLSMLTLNIWN